MKWFVMASMKSQSDWKVNLGLKYDFYLKTL